MAKHQKLELTWTNKDRALIPIEHGRYGYAWVDKADPRYCETHMLEYGQKVAGVQTPKDPKKKYSERADLEPTEDNLLILGESGDVLEALTRVPELREKYRGQVKLVYIDPPFNTAQTFANYEDNLEHSVWLTMMRDRLLLLKDLLSDDGSIWVHLDDVESHRMRVLMDEVFGAGNFVTEIAWETVSAPSNNSGGIPMVTDSICVYSKSATFRPNRLPRKASMDDLYQNPDNDPRGRWTTGDPCARHNTGKRQHPGVYGIQHPITGAMVYPPSSANWRLEQKTILKILQGWGPYDYGENSPEEFNRRAQIEGPGVEIRDDVLPLVIPGWNHTHAEHAKEVAASDNWPDFMLTGGGTGGFRYKRHLRDVRGTVPGSLFKWREVGHSDSAKKEIKALFPGVKPFDTPKPERLLERIIHISTEPGDVVLDIFGGSGTTAAVAHKMGRRWVTCELREDNFERFTQPRLTKVVNGQDPGGVTVTDERELKSGAFLPEKFQTSDLQDATALLNAVEKMDGISNEQIAVLKETKKLIATKPSSTRNWRGGGSFRIATLSPACFGYDPERQAVTLTEAATGDTLVRSIAAQLGFTLTPEVSYFHGVRGAQRLLVVEGMLTKEYVDELLEVLPEGNKLLVAATALDDGVRRHLGRASSGSEVRHIPDDIFRVTASMHDQDMITEADYTAEADDTAAYSAEIVREEAAPAGTEGKN